MKLPILVISEPDNPKGVPGKKTELPNNSKSMLLSDTDEKSPILFEAVRDTAGPIEPVLPLT